MNFVNVKECQLFRKLCQFVSRKCLTRCRIHTYQSRLLLPPDCKEDPPDECLKRDQGVTVTVCGGFGRVGQLTAFLLKQSPLIHELRLYDLKDCSGLAYDLSHISTTTILKSFNGITEISSALQGSDIVVIAAGYPWKLAMTNVDLFALNAGIVRAIAQACAVVCPEAVIGVVTKPVNCFVPLVAEVMRRELVYKPDRVIGMATLEVMKCNTLTTTQNCVDPHSVHIPVVGGACGCTAVPLLTRIQPALNLDQEMISSLTESIRETDHRVTKAKGGQESMVLSAGYAVARFVNTIASGLMGEDNAIMSAYVRSDVIPYCKYFTTQLQFGTCGVKKNYGLPKLTKYELEQVEVSLMQIVQDVKLAEDFLSKDPPSCPLVST